MELGANAQLEADNKQDKSCGVRHGSRTCVCCQLDMLTGHDLVELGVARSCGSSSELTLKWQQKLQIEAGCGRKACSKMLVPCELRPAWPDICDEMADVCAIMLVKHAA